MYARDIASCRKRLSRLVKCTIVRCNMHRLLLILVIVVGIMFASNAARGTKESDSEVNGISSVPILF